MSIRAVHGPATAAIRASSPRGKARRPRLKRQPAQRRGYSPEWGLRRPAPIRAALPPRLLSLIGRSLVVRGEFLAMLFIRDGRSALSPTHSWTVSGTSDRYLYDISLTSPSHSEHYRNVGEEQVVHIIANADPRAPWRGVSALQSAAMAGRFIDGDKRCARRRSGDGAGLHDPSAEHSRFAGGRRGRPSGHVPTCPRSAACGVRGCRHGQRSDPAAGGRAPDAVRRRSPGGMIELYGRATMMSWRLWALAPPCSVQRF